MILYNSFLQRTEQEGIQNPEKILTAGNAAKQNKKTITKEEGLAT